MNKIFGFISELLMIKKDDGMRIGLTQFKTTEYEPVSRKKDVSIRTKDVKLSDLMRRAS